MEQFALFVGRALLPDHSGKAGDVRVDMSEYGNTIYGAGAWAG